ncbi:MAG: phosphomethylpyrimidine synthase ThiC [Candidatus Eisenbacteria bacterium]
MNQIEAARKGILTDEMRSVAERENRDTSHILEGLKAGTIVIPVNRLRRGRYACGVGAGLTTKVNANLGSSSDDALLEHELEKLDAAVEAGADTVMDLSTGGDIDGIRRAVLARSGVPVGTVPIYEAAIGAVKSRRAMVEMTEDEIFSAIERHLASGVDFITVHCGVIKSTIDKLRECGRLTDIVSRGGSFMLEWMYYNDKENPLYSGYDRLLEIAHEYDGTLSLGDGLRPGSLADATDLLQVSELVVMGELVARARRAGVQVMVEGPGHVPLNEIEANVVIEKKICRGAPFYVLGPLVTDVSAGYDHIAGAIGGAIAAAAGADFLCYVTPSEHLRLPDVDDVREGVIASKIAAHAGDIAKGIPGALEWDRKMSQARKSLDWDAMLKLALAPSRARFLRESSRPSDTNLCTMCGEYCAMKKVRDVMGGKPST